MATSDVLGSLVQLTRLAPALVIAAVAMGACSQVSSADGARLMEWLRSSYEINMGALLVLALAAGLYILRTAVPRKPKVSVLDFAVHRPHESWRFPRSALRDLCERSGHFTEEDIQFQEKIAYRTGLGDETGVCPAIQAGMDEALGIEPARFEFSATCFPAIEDLFAKTGVSPQQVKFIVTNSSLFNPTPSLSAMIMNHFKMGSDTKNYSLGGMGCSAGVIALDLAKELLELHPESYALVVSHENITNNYYGGKDKSMLICNCLFRSNGAAILLSNKAADVKRAKYNIRNIVRTNMAADDVAYNCVVQTEDAERKVGVRLNKDLVKVGARALRQNMTALGPKVLPWSELAKFGANSALRSAAKLYKPLAGMLPAGWLDPYTPDFKTAFDFFCIHTGGRGIIDGLEKEMQLNRRQVEPSRASLYRFGNTSSTSVWYELAYVESTQEGVGKGQRVWQLAFGSGFKFNSSVLVANRPVREQHTAWEGFDATAMWADLDKLEAAAQAARAMKEKLSS
uniref:3-ketoacyl-CoA synthase n=1 Tax=Tetradesmus obliquus TaxID=3088 RepID=A0A383VN25_TETOB|eukprot:jgi/Sobl393_1/1421/SZX66152.1